MGDLALEHATDANGRKLLWTFGANDHVEELPADKLKDFKPTGSFRTDFTSLSAKCGIATHPGFVPPPPKENVRPRNKERGSALPVPNSASPVPPKASSEPKPEGTVLSLQSILVGRAAMLVFRHVIPTASNLEVLRLTGCYLDMDALALLRAGLTESCTVAVLQLDWNPVEVPIDAAALKLAVDAEQVEQIDALEREREQQQAERSLRAFSGMLATRFGDMPAALKSLSEAAWQSSANSCGNEATAVFEPFPLSAWADAFYSVLNADASDTEHIFNIVDGPLYDTGDGLASFKSLETILTSLPEPVVEDEAADPVGKAFAAFADSTSPLDVISFRHCRLGRLECVAMGRALSQTPHLRGINLWGNNICDLGAALLAEALEANQGLQFLGLGRNCITNVGLEKLCDPLGYTRVDEKAQADQISKDIKEKAKEKEKRKPQVPKKDLKGGDRYIPDFVLPTCEQQSDASGDFWLWCRNTTLKTLNVEHNPITDASAVMKLQPLGMGELCMKGVPCAAALSQLYAEATTAPETDAAVEEEPAPKLCGPGWRFTFQ